MLWIKSGRLFDSEVGAFGLKGGCQVLGGILLSRVAGQMGLRFVGARAMSGTHDRHTPPNTMAPAEVLCKLTWLVLGGDPAARSHRVEQLTAL